MILPNGNPATPTRLLLGTGAALALAACASHPDPLQGHYSPVTPHVAMHSDATGALVRWGGRIVQVEPRANETCFEMVSARLTESGRPSWTGDDTQGRFIACRAGFHDPAVFTVNREVTFIGGVTGYEMRRFGEYDYRFPRVAVDEVQLWPRRDQANPVTRPAPWPWWGRW